MDYACLLIGTEMVLDSNFDVLGYQAGSGRVGLRKR
ncbi:MAG: hypothetical protein ACI8XC_000178 [Gammaproteobacteria bacterium]|jgi:hypothetical protein